MTFCRIPGSAFMLLLDSFFDILNVRNSDESTHKHREDLKPYRSPDDKRSKGVTYMTN